MEIYDKNLHAIMLYSVHNNLRDVCVCLVHTNVYYMRAFIHSQLGNLASVRLEYNQWCGFFHWVFFLFFCIYCLFIRIMQTER